MFFYKVMAFVAISRVYPASVCVIVSRTPPDRIPYAARSDSVRRPIRFRTGDDGVA